MMMPVGRHHVRFVLCLVFALAGCNSKPSDEGAKNTAQSDEADATQHAHAKAKVEGGGAAEAKPADEAQQAAGDDGEPKKREKKDFGEGSMVLDGEPWAGTSAKAKMKNTTLILTIARNDFSDAKAKREELKLYLSEFAGPGDYVASERGSQFLRVGVNTDKLDEGEAKANAEAKKSVRGANRIAMNGLKVTVETADDDKVTGTFSRPGEHGVEVADGKFRAVFRTKK